MLLFSNIVDFIFPPACISCGAIVEENNKLCPNCTPKFQYISNPSCHRCGTILEYSIDNIEICEECVKFPPYYDRNLSIFAYNEAVRLLVSRLKYYDNLNIANFFGNLLYKKYLALLKEESLQAEDIHIFCPVPMHFKKFIKRKYNQSALLLKTMAGFAKLNGETDFNNKITHNLIRKKHNTEAQASLSQYNRRRNVKNSFEITKDFAKDLAGKNIIVIDDVTTTTSTLNEIARVLKNEGANKVYALTVAKVITTHG